MASNQFDWNDADVHVVRSYGDIAVYTNTHGDIAVRQQDPLGADDSIVIVPRQQAVWLISAIESELKKAVDLDARDQAVSE